MADDWFLYVTEHAPLSGLCLCRLTQVYCRRLTWIRALLSFVRILSVGLRIGMDVFCGIRIS